MVVLLSLFFQILDSAGNILWRPGDEVSVSVAENATANIVIRFNPTPCGQTEYTSSFLIYYEASEALKLETVEFVALVDDNTEDSLTCDTDNSNYYDEFNNPTIRTLPALDNGEKYYIKITKMNAYIQTTGSFVQFATAVGTNIKVDLIPEENLFEPVYIPLTSDANGNVVVEEFTECTDFYLPSPITDEFFIGAVTTVTSRGDYTGTIDRDGDTPGRLNVHDLVFKLRSFINNPTSLLQDSDGYFEADVKFDLTTGTTETSEYLSDLINLTDDTGARFLNIENNRLVGRDIRHGTITLVGIGSFIDNEDARLSGEARQGILENEAYLFLQIEGLVTQKIE